MDSVLNNKTIVKLLSEGMKIVDPFEKENVGPASIDLRLGNTYYEYNMESYRLGDEIDDSKVEKKVFETLPIKNGQTRFVGILEKIYIPENAIGIVLPRSSISRLGIHISTVYANPGYSGNLPLTIINHSGFPITLKPGTRVVQLILFSTNETPDKQYKDIKDAKYHEEFVDYSKIYNDKELQEIVDNAIKKATPNLHKLLKDSSRY